MSNPFGGRDIYECANQLSGYVGPDTPNNLAEFLLRESEAAEALADQIVRLDKLVGDMMAVMINRLDTKEAKVNALLLRAIEERAANDTMPD